MKKLGIILVSLLLAAPIMGATTVSTSLSLEGNDYDNVDKEKEDKIIIGAMVKHSLSEKTSIRLDHRYTDYTYFNDKEKLNENRKEELFIYLDNKILNNREGLSLDLNVGTKRENYDFRDSNDHGVDYRIQPRWKYAITKDITLGGNWLFYKTKNIDGRYDDQYSDQYGHELDTGITYTGIENYKMDVSLYNEKHFSLMDDNDFEKTVSQLRARVSTKVGKFDLAPWLGIQLGDYETIKKDGTETEKGKTVNRYGVDVATVYDKVRYTASVYIQTSTYDEDDYDYSRVNLRLGSSYRF